jgi:hypothetical protein
MTIHSLTKPVAYVAHFTDGSSDTLVRVVDCGIFLTGLAMRGDGYYRTLFFDHHGVLHQPDPWIANPLEVIR